MYDQQIEVQMTKQNRNEQTTGENKQGRASEKAEEEVEL